MAEYYSIQEVAEKLRKTEDEVQGLVKDGKLCQYMDSGNPVFKVEEVDSLVEEIIGLDVSSVGLAQDGSEIEIRLEETAEIELEPDDGDGEGSAGSDDMELAIEPDKPDQKESEGGFDLSQMGGDLTMADTNVGTVGINILSGTGDAYKLTEDTKAETSADDLDDLDGLDADSNMESFGSGSGLLDLSLQADDTSLGAVLDDILPAGAEDGNDGGADFPINEAGLADETEELPAEGDPQSAGRTTAPMGAGTAVLPIAAPVAAVVDSRTNIFGVLMFFPLLALILAAIVLTAAIQNVAPALTQPLVTTEIAGISLIWIIIGGLTVLLLLLLAFSALAGGGGGGTKTKKAKKARKEKKPKKAKPAKKKRK
ncbi:MAG: hypothetical protein B6I25_05475 [Planctomycetales bacterium 4572_13]|nr:MAG: hypothetical protein B6I25_05475 [Planctomycetales bacterium 4572_13]